MIKMENNILPHLQKEFIKIPFVDIILPYTDIFLHELKKMELPYELVMKCHKSLLHELSTVAEVTMQEELDFFKSDNESNYEDFVVSTKLVLIKKYPVLDSILKRISINHLSHIQNIYSNFNDDLNAIAIFFSLSLEKNVFIKDIDSSLGDGHSGESTTLITLSEGTKLIYKPRNISTSESYNLFINWVNKKLGTDLKILKCLSRETYGWLEFANHDFINSYDELEEYYYKAGILLAITLLLGSKDCHYENLIACGKNPVIIDHETIIQPVLSNQSLSTWDKQHKVPFFSVLESMLIVNEDTGVPLQYAGFGNKGNVDLMDLEKKVVNPNTINSKRDTRFVFRKLAKENVPVYKQEYTFANDYINQLIKGFSITYDMFMDSKVELMSNISPLRFFDNLKIRYVWRPTFVYFRILKYMRSASYMSCFELHESKLYELMSKAYKDDNLEYYKFILASEMKQMLMGDIPMFELNSLDCCLENNNSAKIFQYNCIENINYRIELLSTNHKNEQIEYIANWLKINKIN